MKKVMVIGCPGSGKSTLSRSRQALTGLPLYHLDQLNWKKDRTTVDKALFRKRLLEIIQREQWILDGNYGSTLELRMQACDTILFLDYPVEVCLEGVLKRRGQPRPDLPWVEDADELDHDFLTFIKDYPAVSRPQVLDLLEQYADKTIRCFSSREEASAFLSQLEQEKKGKEKTICAY